MWQLPITRKACESNHRTPGSIDNSCFSILKLACWNSKRDQTIANYLKCIDLPRHKQKGRMRDIIKIHYSLHLQKLPFAVLCRARRLSAPIQEARLRIAIGTSLASECFPLRPPPVTTASQDIFTCGPANSFPKVSIPLKGASRAVREPCSPAPFWPAPDQLAPESP